jgi:hypothetical protein
MPKANQDAQHLRSRVLLAAVIITSVLFLSPAAPPAQAQIPVDATVTIRSGLDSVHLTWHDRPGDGYLLYRWNGGARQLLATLGPGELSYTDTPISGPACYLVVPRIGTSPSFAIYPDLVCALVGSKSPVPVPDDLAPQALTMTVRHATGPVLADFHWDAQVFQPSGGYLLLATGPGRGTVVNANLRLVQSLVPSATSTSEFTEAERMTCFFVVAVSPGHVRWGDALCTMPVISSLPG